MPRRRPDAALLALAAVAAATSCAGAAARPPPAPARANLAPAVPPDPFRATGVLVPAVGAAVRIVATEERDDGFEVRAAASVRERADAERRAETVFRWARLVLHARHVHAVRVVIHPSPPADPPVPFVFRYGFDALQGWRRREEAAREADRRSGPLDRDAIDTGDEVDARAAAEAWLALVDASAYDDALASAPLLAARAPRAAWTSYLREVPALQGPRRPLFALHADGLRELPGGPFVILTFLAETAQGWLLETAAVQRGDAGWTVASYDAYEAGPEALAFAAVS